ncbi:MAG: nucleotidyltransferase substrate binding protein [Eubacterium sp.]|nr:nucleotidyltransferase substrate binding protein [Eubacterium sp.]
MDELLALIQNAALKYKSIRKLVLFGSRARGDDNKESDYDIAVFGAVEQDQLLFKNAVDELPTLHKIDLVFVDEKTMNTPLYDSIQKEGKIIMSKFGQKLDNYQKALARLHDAVADSQKDISNLTMRDGVIQRFEFTTELAWKATREYLIEQGEVDINSPKPVMQAAFRTRLIDDENGWLSILNDRNHTSHIYDDSEADAVFKRILEKHIQLFDALLKGLTACSGSY